MAHDVQSFTGPLKYPLTVPIRNAACSNHHLKSWKDTHFKSEDFTNALPFSSSSIPFIFYTKNSSSWALPFASIAPKPKGQPWENRFGELESSCSPLLLVLLQFVDMFLLKLQVYNLFCLCSVFLLPGNKNRDSCPCMTNENPFWHKTDGNSAPLLSSTRAHLGPPTEVRTLGLDCFRDMMELTEPMKPSDRSICIKPPSASSKSSLCKMWTWSLNFGTVPQETRLRLQKDVGGKIISSWHLLTLVRFYYKRIMQHI